MILDYNPDNRNYILHLPRGEGDANQFRTEYGLDFSRAASRVNEAVLFTNEPYAAATFIDYATPAARAQLGYITSRIEASRKATSDAHFRVPQRLRDSGTDLWPFQKASVEYILHNLGAGLGVIDGDEPGLGKTPTAIVTANELKARHVLVVCPAVIRNQWVEKITQWSTLGGFSYAITTSKLGVHEDATWTVISWDLISSPGIWRALSKQRFDLLVLDEAHKAKTVSSKRSRALYGGGRALPDDVVPLIELAQYTVALTGTLLPNRPRELWPLARHLHWEAIDWLSERNFNERFNPRNETQTSTGKVWVDEAVGRLPELQNRLRANLMVRHLKREVMPQLQYPIYDIIRVEPTSAVKEALEAERMLDLDLSETDAFIDWGVEIDGHIAEVRQQMGVAIAPQVATWCDNLIDGGEKIVVFAHHVAVLDILQEKLAEHNPVRIDGSNTAKQKDERKLQFMRDPSSRVLIGNMLSLGTGTDGLQEVSSHCLLAEPDWTPGNNQQAIDRLDRGGQTGQVQADLFCAPGSLLEKILGSALRKGSTIHKALDMRIRAA